MNDEYSVVDPKKSSKKILFLGISLALLFAIVMAVYFFTKISKAVSSESMPVNFTVEKGSTSSEIAERLEEENLIHDSFIFQIYSKATSAGSKFQAGDYILDRNMSIADIVDVLTAGKVVRSERKVTVVEGTSNKNLALYLESRNIFDTEVFNAALEEDYDFEFEGAAAKVNFEGFLFPDTYQIATNAEASALVQKMLANFETKLDATLRADMEARNLDLIDVVTLASIIEREVGRNKEALTEKDREDMQRERELVASVFYNRLEAGMALESDATVNYVTGKSDRQATFEDLKVQSPYNTYLNRGLPPGPISNPGLGAIRAAIYPATSDYLYFLNDIEGVAYFGKTLAEHNENRRKYLD